MRISVVRIRSSKRAISVVFIYLSFSFAYILLESSENIVYNSFSEKLRVTLDTFRFVVERLLCERVLSIEHIPLPLFIIR